MWIGRSQQVQKGKAGGDWLPAQISGTLGIMLLALARTTLLIDSPFAATRFAMAMDAMHEIRQILTGHVCAPEQSTWYVVSLVPCLVFGNLVRLCICQKQSCIWSSVLMT